MAAALDQDPAAVDGPLTRTQRVPAPSPRRSGGRWGRLGLREVSARSGVSVAVWLWRQWPAVAVLAAFAATAFVVPTLAPVATTDDWGYSRSVEILHDEGRLTVFPVVAATAVFQIGWGWLFSLALGMTLGVMRISTLAMTMLGGIALFALLREVGVSRGRSALGLAAYLFNPLAFILSYTFMTDPFFTALLLLATAAFARGLRVERPGPGFVVLGSALAGMAFLTRQQGALIPLAVALHLLASGRLRLTWAGVRLFAQVVALPLLTTAGYYVWLRRFNDVPAVQQGFFDEAKAGGLDGAWRLLRNLTFIELMYLGFFALPLTFALLPGLRRGWRTMGRGGWLLFSLLNTAVIAGLAIYGQVGSRMPYVAQFVGAGGIGPPDVLGARPRVFNQPFFDWATGVCAVSTILLLFLICRGARGAPDSEGDGLSTPRRGGAGLVLAVGLWQVVGILPPSFHYINRGYSLDRYLLPLLPLGICLLLWATPDLRLLQPLGWLVVGVFGCFAVAGTHDYLVYMENVWSVANGARDGGVPVQKIDAGAAWDGYHLYTYGLDNGIASAQTQGGPWWTTFYGLASDSTYVVSSRPQNGYDLIASTEYPTWLGGDNPMYLLRRV